MIELKNGRMCLVLEDFCAVMLLAAEVKNELEIDRITVDKAFKIMYEQSLSFA